MFINFFSGHVYEPQWWPSAFQIENMIQAILREDWREMIGLKDDELIASLRSRIERFGDGESGRHLVLDKSFVKEFLSREVSNINSLLCELRRDNEEDDIATLDSRFLLNEKQLRECMKSSLEFRNFIQA